MFKEKKDIIEVIKFGYDLKKIINEWDPINILDITLEDEYESEIREIREKILKIIDVINIKKISIILKEVFLESFDEEYVSIQKIENIIASKIFDVIKFYNFQNFSLREYNRNKILNIEDIEKYYKIKEIINEWDPIKIIDFSFENEYCYEINEIIYFLKKDKDNRNLQFQIKEIFKNSYGKLYNATSEEEQIVMRKILNIY